MCMHNEWEWLCTQPEGQFLERKGLTDIKSAVDKIAETLVAMANAEGGTVVFGIEDDGTVSGVPERYNLERIKRQVAGHIVGTLPFRTSEITIEGRRVWVFEVDWRPEVYQLTDGRYLYRHNDQNIPFDARDIDAIKRSRRQLLTEAQFVPEANLSDLNTSLIEEVAKRAGIAPDPLVVLNHYRLAEPRNGRIILTLASLLLFSKQPAQWHPRCGIDFAIWQGTERKTGAEFNIKKRIRIENLPLPLLIQTAYERIREHLPQRQSLVTLFFEERFVYPDFAWQEAIVNAVAHRDYGIKGTEIEVDLFDDHLEVRSPGELVEPVTLERLFKRERVHASRNPRIARVLTDYGYMRERGEGIPRMFEVMEAEGLHPPQFRMEGGCFIVVLKSKPIYRQDTMHWLSQLERLGLSRNQKRILAYAREHHGKFSTRDYQSLCKVDPYTAGRDIRDLIRKGIIVRDKPRGRTYRLVEETQAESKQPPEEILSLMPILETRGFVKNADFREVFQISISQARNMARRLVETGWLIPEGERKGRKYRLAKTLR